MVPGRRRDREHHHDRRDRRIGRGGSGAVPGRREKARALEADGGLHRRAHRTAGPPDGPRRRHRRRRQGRCRGQDRGHASGRHRCRREPCGAGRSGAQGHWIGRQRGRVVLVSHDREFVFLKTRKTAGTSVEMLLEPFCVPPGTPIAEATPYRESAHGIVGRRLGTGKRPPHWKLRTHAYAVEVRLAIGARRFARYVKISTVRNPFDRTVSYFHWINQERLTGMRDFADIRSAFHDWVLTGRWHSDSWTVHLFGRYVVDHMVRFERLAKDMASLNRDLDLGIDPGDLPTTKSMARTRKAYDVPDYFDAETEARVRKRQSWVFDYFDYPTRPISRFDTEVTP
ncbi:hypothetical protein DXV76_16080 [Rhodobacteraceae bacterium CCMM004]|nr:hypothetical protein DXV76_16080 [Rhodobacteraceae bacterium CCMM004]